MAAMMEEVFEPGALLMAERDNIRYICLHMLMEYKIRTQEEQMLSAEKRFGRLVDVARMYYEQNMTQNEIAKKLGISRPLVSVLLAEARENGIVSIRINDTRAANDELAQRIMDRFWLSSVTVVMNDEGQNMKTDDLVAIRAYEEFFGKKNRGKSAGIGWGTILGKMADYAETIEKDEYERGLVFPLAGGIQAVTKGYHANELVRVFSLSTGRKAEYLYTPALFDTQEDLNLIKKSKPFIDIDCEWDAMEHAIIGVSDYPGYPDLAVKTIYGDRLMKEAAVGRILAYYFDVNGNIIVPKNDAILQVSLNQLKATDVTAVCSRNIRPIALAGALNLRLINRLIVPYELAVKLLNISQNRN